MAPAPGRAQSISVMDECVAEFIKRIVQRMSLAESMTILKAWGFLTERELQSLSTRKLKENLAMEVVHLCEVKKATLNHASDLDIVYYHANSTKRSWDVYQLAKLSDPEMHLHVDLSELKVQFHKSVRSVIKNVTINFKVFGDALWIRIAWGKNCAKPNEYRPTFVVHHTQTPYAFFTNLPKTHRPLVCQAVLFATGYSQIQQLELKSRCLESLKDIVFRRFHQPFQSYHTRSHQENIFTPAIVDPRVCYEDIKEKERIHELTRETFGDGPLPKLEYASYKLETSFKGGNYIASRTAPFRCVVKFTSPHLLDSIRALAPAGLAEAPVSSLLSCIPNKARNIFKISDKKTLQPSSSQAAN